MTTSESTRPRRFALPDLEDERTGESIEAFLHGRRTSTASPGTAAAQAARAAGLDHAAPAMSTGVAIAPTGAAMPAMPGRLDWHQALDREVARTSRYERPAAVAVLELRPLRPSAAIDSWLRTHAAPVGHLLLQQSRATDMVARVGPARFQVLLPETTAEAAGEFVGRVVAACHEQLRAVGAPLRLAAAFAATGPELPLRDAVAHAARSIEAA